MIALLLAAALVGQPECCPLPHTCGMTPAIMGYHPPPCIDPCKGAEMDPIRLSETWITLTPDYSLAPMPGLVPPSSLSTMPAMPVLPADMSMIGPPAPQTDAEYRARIEALEESSARSRRMLWYVSMNFACAGADLWTTSDAIERGFVEGNPFGKTVEKRVGLKLTQAAVSAVANWLIDRAWGAKAGWISASGTAGVQCGAAISNLSQ